MSSWIFLVVLVGAMVTLFMMVVGIVAMWTRKMQLISGGRALYGPLAQLCGLWLLAALPLSAVTCGQVAYVVGAQPDPGPARAKAMEFLLGRHGSVRGRGRSKMARGGQDRGQATGAGLGL